ncbi:SDR family oxidoreductase [Homoserinibacter sp. YIM 151385]|uniref:SDR family oxidoreductase n=1 Tax=Homoserinibacter sp. YIM 151385 TaxID=2985506 RepID=UPI0022F0B876|nr:SDR family oxidoreductase [Homoserinibacter sp. YIM 151385]WBU36890.1 SDR family oxidoreductase [Homoserinibacter sp. YIM 151385]
MRILIAGGHGKIARLLARILADDGHEPVALIRNPDHAADVEEVGAQPLVLDLEAADPAEIARHLEGVDAVVFAAGAGPGSTPERKLTVDRDGAVKLRHAAELAGTSRYVLVSAIGADRFDPESDDVFQVYLRAKSEADADLRSSELDWTIVRPGGLTDGPATGLVEVAEEVERGEVARADVAYVVAHVITAHVALRQQFELVAGSTPVAEALNR